MLQSWHRGRMVVLTDVFHEPPFQKPVNGDREELIHDPHSIVQSLNAAQDQDEMRKDHPHLFEARDFGDEVHSKGGIIVTSQKSQVSVS